MANTNAPFGFRLQGINGGSVPATFGTITRKIASNNTTAIFKGDAVKNLNTGYIDQWTNGTVVSQLAGIFSGCKYYSTSQKKIVWSPYWPGADATGDVEAYLDPCINSPAGIFLVQAAATAITFADIGLNVDVTVNAGNTSTGISGMTIQSGTLAVTATLPFRIVDLYSSVAAPGAPGTEASSYNWVLVAANVAQSTGL